MGDYSSSRIYVAKTASCTTIFGVRKPQSIKKGKSERKINRSASLFCSAT